MASPLPAQGARSSPLPLWCRGEHLEPQAGLERQRPARAIARRYRVERPDVHRST